MEVLVSATVKDNGGQRGRLGGVRLWTMTKSLTFWLGSRRQKMSPVA